MSTEDTLKPFAYLYHDAGSAETADPMLNSTLLVLAAERNPRLRNETPLVMLNWAQQAIDAAVAAERERCAAIAESWATEETATTCANIAAAIRGA